MMSGQDDDLQTFQVDLRGVVDLLSRHIYSSPRVYLRELLQNGRDAIAARTEHDGGTAGRGIHISPIDRDNDTFVLRDDGVGLTASEMTELLSTVGRSSKRDLFDLPRTDYLGQFGIGLLSCFMVADRIVIRSQSARGGRPVEWIGNSDGTFTVTELDEELPVGTSVHLTPRFDQAELLKTATVLSLATTFGEYLPVPVCVDLSGGATETVTREPTYLGEAESPESLEFGRDLIGAPPFAAIALAAPASGTRGVAYVLPYAPAPGSRQASRVYLGRMLLGERVDDLLPDWAFFVRVVVDSTGLSPTASREDLVEDASLEYTRTELGAALRRWVMELTVRAPHRLEEFVSIHAIALKALVLHDDELARFITRWLPLETSVGRLSIDSLVRRYPRLRYTETIDEYRQIETIASPSEPVINGGYIYDTEIARMLPSLFDDVTVERADMVSELDRLATPPLADHALVASLEERASAALTGVGCAVVVRSIDDADVPAIHVSDPETLRRLDRERTRDIASSLWSGVLQRIDDVQGVSSESPASRLCLNWSSPVVRMLAGLHDDAVFPRSVHLLYVQALLSGHRPLTAADRALMTTAMTDLIHLSVGLPEENRP